tara:strand:+ start:1702 stop:3003 length:1302 start_codon:yes stop_codon:yes gene_type:complete
MKKVSLILDNPKRDKNYIILIAMHLAKNNCEVTIVPTNMRHYELMHTEPDYVLYPHQRHKSSQEIAILNESNIDIGVLETEQHVKEDYYLEYQTPKNISLLQNTVHMFSWGHNFSTILKKNSLYTEDQIKTVGNPKYDSYFFENMKPRDKTLKLLIGTGFGIANPKFISQREQKKAFIKENMSEQDYLSYYEVHQESLDKLIELVNSGFFPLDQEIELRPHPYEDEKIYKQKIKSVNIENSKSIDEQLFSSESYVHYHSTASIDASVLMVPSINLAWFPVNHKLHGSTPFMEKISYQPSNMIEMKNLIDEIYTTGLKPKTNIKDKIFEEYLYKLDGKSHVRIANEILLQLNNKKKLPMKRFIKPFNNIKSIENSIKFRYAKKQWLKSAKKFEVGDITITLNYLNDLFNLNNQYNIEELFLNKLKLGSIKISKQ